MSNTYFSHWHNVIERHYVLAPLYTFHILYSCRYLDVNNLSSLHHDIFRSLSKLIILYVLTLRTALVLFFNNYFIRILYYPTVQRPPDEVLVRVISWMVAWLACSHGRSYCKRARFVCIRWEFESPSG